MGHILNRVGHKYGRLIVLNKKPIRANNKAIVWACRCECGKIVNVRGNSLNGGGTKSCGCITLELRRKQITHGHSKRNKISKSYWRWHSMKSRCADDSNKNYGNRDIRVCKRWLNSFENFLKDMGECPSVNHSIDRINVNKGYSPKNCRWATRAEQSRNKRNNVFIKFNNKNLCVKDWAKELGMEEMTLRCRLFKMKWSIEDSFTKPVKKK